MTPLARRCLAIVSCTAILGLPGFATTSVARAMDLQTLVCAGSASTSYNPGLTDTAQQLTVTVDEALGSDASGVGACTTVGAPITGGTHHHTRVLTLSCQSALTPTPITEQFTWNTGATSTVSFTTSRYTDEGGETVITRVGTVTDGFGAGDTATQTVTLLNSDLAACSSPGGLTHINGATTLTFL